MDEFQQQLEQEKDEALVESNAQAIFDHLDEITNKADVHQRRWVWELLQNSKDSTTGSQKVSVEIVLQDSNLIFRHNGNPFSNKEITHLVYHGSTKKGQTDKTGKFGTGFITTHLLSKRVRVSGILTSNKQFQFFLDRTGSNPKEIEIGMEASWKEFIESLREQNSEETKTEYAYELDERAKAVAQKGLDDLPSLLPFVLALNPKFEAISLQTPELKLSFRSNPANIAVGQGVTIVNIEEFIENQPSVQHNLVMSSDGITTVALRLRCVGDSFDLERVEPDMPRLFLDFPLFGTEDFSFPAIINSSSFRPERERNGVFLGPEPTEAVLSNKGLIKGACNLYLNLVDHASSARWGNLYELAFITVPTQKDWLDPSWYKQTLQELLEAIVTKPIVKTERTDYISPKNALFPIDYPLADLWDLSFPLFPSNLPAKIHVEPWFKILNSWSGLQGKPLESFDNTNTFHKLCKTLTELATLENLEATLQTANAVEAIAWLNRFYQLILSQGKKLLFESYAVIPNQNRLFKKKTPALFLDEQIDEAIKDISKAIGDDWRDRLVLGTVSLDNSLLAHKTQEEVLSSTILTLKQQAAKTHQDSTLRKPVIDLLVWLVQQQRTDLIADIPAVSRKVESDSPIPFSKFSVTGRLLVPPELWQNVPSDFAQLFPPDFVLASDYTERLTATHWEILTSSNFIYADPIYYEMTRLDTQSLPLGETEQKEHRLQEIECSRIVFLDHPKDKSVYDRIRSSKPRSILFFKFLLFCALDKDSNWLTVLPVSCDCGVEHSVFPSHWLYYVRSNRWIRLAGGAQTPSAQSLAELLKGEPDIISKLKEDKPARFLDRIGIGVGDLLRNIITQGDESKKLEWDKAFGAILTSGLDPSQLLAEFEERERNREKVRANQELGKKIEGIFAATFSSDEFKAHGFNIERTGIGSDYEVEHDFIDGNEEQLLNLSASQKAILVEIKSTVKPFCTMTSTQGKKAVDNAASFCLCVVPLTGVDITEDIVRTTARFVTNIGELLKPKVSEASSLQELQTEAVSASGDIQIDMSEAQVKYRINQTIWQNGKSFDEFVSLLMNS